jgi:hypothetical protein
MLSAWQAIVGGGMILMFGLSIGMLLAFKLCEICKLNINPVRRNPDPSNYSFTCVSCGHKSEGGER